MASVPKTLPPVTVVTAGTRVQIDATVKFARSVRVVADSGNSGNIFVGDRNVSSSQYGDKLGAGDAYEVEEGLYDLSRIYVDADTNSQKVQISYVPA